MNAAMDLKEVEGCSLSLGTPSLDSASDLMICLMYGCDLAHSSFRPRKNVPHQRIRPWLIHKPVTPNQDFILFPLCSRGIHSLICFSSDQISRWSILLLIGIGNECGIEIEWAQSFRVGIEITLSSVEEMTANGFRFHFAPQSSKFTNGSK